MRYWTVTLVLAMTVTACGGSDNMESSTDKAETARKILGSARDQLGAVESFATIRAEANVVGPNSEFVTIVWSGRDGRARMEQSGGFAVGVHPGGNWRIDSATGRVEPLDDPMLAFLRGHELHAAVLVPESRYHSPEFSGDVEFGDQLALAVSLKDNLGDTMFAYFSAVDTVPLGFRLTQPDPDVDVTLGGWKRQQNLLVFTRAIITQGDEEYRYEYVDIQLNNVPDSVFAAPTDGFE
jgi:hypothetical protein